MINNLPGEMDIQQVLEEESDDDLNPFRDDTDEDPDFQPNEESSDSGDSNAGEEEEWGSEGEADRASTEGKTPITPATAPEVKSASGSPAPSPPPAPGPKLRLNASLATDPALRPGAAAAPAVVKTEPPTTPASPADLEYLASLPSALQNAIVAGRLFCVPPLSSAENAAASGRKPIPEPAESRQASVPVYICNPCGIKFSSPSTLEAHQTYYCSHRLASQTKAVIGNSTVSGGGGAESEPEDVKPVLEGREDASGGESSTGEPATKSVKSGKQYRCPHCSYSADKKVSLNRHMRMHSTSPASQTGSTTDAADTLVDRYCQDCDIRFSSMKTFKAHKMHYCSTRHVIKTGKPISAPSSPSESRTTPTSPGASENSNHLPRDGGGQPFLALPTNPVLIVPYSLFQGASILSGPAVMGFPAQDTACLLLPDGTLQPLAQGLLPLTRPSPQIPTDVPKRQRNTSETVVKQPEETRHKNGMSEPPSGAPLDLSVRPRDEEGELVIDMEEEDEKENRQSVDNQPNIFPSPDPEDIICAPSIPLLLSTSSTCSSPSPAPPSPALSSSSYSAGNRKHQESKRQRTDSQSSSPSPKSSPSGAKSPRRTPNGLNVSDKFQKQNDLKSKSSVDAVTSPPKLDNGNITLSSLLLAAAAHSQMDGFQGKSESALPFPPDLVSHLSGSRISGGKGKPIPALPALIPAAGRNLPILLPKPPRTPADLMNPASMIPLLTSEMALRIAAATGQDPSASMPQVLVKQGVSKCNECNIVFCKHENYVAHKKHYCSARQVNEPIIVQDDDSKPASPALSTTPPHTSSPPASGGKDQSHSPISASPGPTSSASKATHYQFICAACGIKFTSYDNLTAHQAYYCPKRATVEEKGSRRCGKCKHTVPMDHVCGSAGGQWKCPCCHIISPTASAAQKHMDTHTGVKAFLCTICRYKGNTLRGMRTHIRMHFEKRTSEIMEENYITCLLEDGTGGCIELPAMDGEENHARKTPDTHVRSVNGESKVKVKEEVERREQEEEDEEYIEVDEVNIKTEPQDCKDSKNAILRRSEKVVTNLTRGVQVHR